MYGPVYCEIESNRIYITSQMTDREKCKQIPGCRWDKDKKMWHAPVSWATCKVLRSTFMDRLQIGPTLMEWAKLEVTERIAPSVALRDALTVQNPEDLVAGLYPFQQAGALFLMTAKHALLGDPMGAGKTIQIIAAARAIQEKYEASKRSVPYVWELERCESEAMSPLSTSMEQGTALTECDVPTFSPASGRTTRRSELLLKCPVHGEIPYVPVGQLDRQAGRCMGLHPSLCLVSSPDGSPIKSAMAGEYVTLSKAEEVSQTEGSGGSLPLLVICPASMRRTWGREVEKWWPGVPVYIVEGTAAKRAKIFATAADNPGVVIMNWESVRLHSRLAPYGSIALTDKEKEPKQLNQIPFKTVVADEAHRMKDPKSKQTRAVWAVGHNSTVIYRWAMSGTPLTNKPDTLWPILHFLNPNEWPGKTAYVDRYCLSSLNVWGGLEVFGINPNTAAEFYDIFDPRFRRMPKEIILPQLPPIVNEIRHVEMTKKQADAYKAMVEDLCAVDSNGEMIVASNPISQLTRCTQFASAYLEVQDDGSARLCDPSCKLDLLMEDLEDISEPVVVFAVSRQLIDMASARLEKAGVRHSVVKGGQSNDQRQNAIDDFQNGNVDIILVVIAAGGVGITLTRSRIAIFLQRSWSNVDQQQAIGRIHRIGSEIHDSVVILDYVTTATIEEGQLAVLAGKADSLEEIIRDKDAIRRLMNGEMP